MTKTPVFTCLTIAVPLLVACNSKIALSETASEREPLANLATTELGHQSDKPPPSAKARVITTRFSSINRDATAPSLNDVYLRLRAVPPDTDAASTVQFKELEWYQQLWNGVKSYLFRKDEVLLVTLGGAIGGNDFGKRSLILVKGGEDASETYGDYFLTPFFRTGDSLQLQAATAHTVKADSNVVSALITVFGAIGKVYAPNGVLFKAISGSKDLSDQVKKADDVLGRTFSVDESKSTALTAYNPNITDHFELHIGEAKSPLLIVQFESRESLIAPDGKSASISPRVSEITGKKLEGGPIVSTLIEGKQDLMAALNKASADGYAEFCTKAGQSLVSQGFNFIDRSVILYAYLANSPWNTSASMRRDIDSCTQETSGLAQTKLTLRSRSDIDAQSEVDRKKTIDAMNQKKNGIWQKLPPLLASPTADKWDEMAASSISLISVKYDLRLSDSVTLKAGVAQSFESDTVRDILTSVKLKYDKQRAIDEGIISENCFSVQDTQTSSFRGYCFYSNNGAATKPITMEFDFDKAFSSDQPLLQTIKFYPRADG